MMRVCPAVGQSVKAHILGPALALSASSLVQDLALDSLLDLLQQMVVSGAVEHKELLRALNGRLEDKVGRHGIYALAQCIARATSSGTVDDAKAVLVDVVSTLDSLETPSDDALLRKVQASLLIPGDVGRTTDLSSLDGLADRLKSIYLSYFESPSDDLKQAAAYSLGNAAVGSQAAFLPLIVGKLDEDNKKQQYLLLSALREFVQSSSRLSGGESIAASLSVILPQLSKHCGDAEESVRSMVAECMGSLAAARADAVLAQLVEIQKTHDAIDAPGGIVAEGDVTSETNARVCWTVATAIKIGISGKMDQHVLLSHMPTFVQLVKKEELHVRQAALMMVCSAVHHMPQVVSSLFKDTISPTLLEVSTLKMQRTVDLGPFKHKVDDALPLRKAGLSVYTACLEKMPTAIEISEFMPVLAAALADVEDIQLQAHQLLMSMCTRYPIHVISSIDSFVDPLEKTANKKAGQKTGTELDRLNDWIKSALRVMVAIGKIDGARNSRKFVDFEERVKGNSKFATILESIGDERH